jgi:hypothetical protein
LVAPINSLSDETLLPEWSGNLGGEQRRRSSVVTELEQASLLTYGVKRIELASEAGLGKIKTIPSARISP